jgi:mannose-6-phosphate isomerase-like protein (cupin superfamily)
MSQYVEKIEHNGKILAIIARAQAIKELEEKNEQMLFVTPDEFPFQIGIHNRPAGNVIKEHFHVPFEKLEDFPVQEFFYVISGRVHIDLYDDRENDTKVSEVIIQEGDSIVLNTGHGFTLLDDCKLIELKQGPYRGKDMEKRYFS